jgi:hypothetical protein
MFDFTAMMAHWGKAVAVQMPSAEEEIFKAKLSRLGVKAPFGTPPAEAQLAKAVAKAQLSVGGSGNFMGDELHNGINSKVITAEMMVDHNVPLRQAKVMTEQFYKGL